MSLIIYLTICLMFFQELNHLVNSVANGLSSDELYKRSLEEIMPLRIISLLRLLAETEIRNREADYKSFIPEKMNVHQVLLQGGAAPGC
uniref:Uncharacterized protein n=1 Tax=Aegilops tauschii subsp. strangulata TaxID=200361 RepID=A0A453AEH6_AEGTS